MMMMIMMTQLTQQAAKAAKTKQTQKLKAKRQKQISGNRNRNQKTQQKQLTKNCKVAKKTHTYNIRQQNRKQQHSSSHVMSQSNPLQFRLALTGPGFLPTISPLFLPPCPAFDLFVYVVPTDDHTVGPQDLCNKGSLVAGCELSSRQQMVASFAGKNWDCKPLLENCCKTGKCSENHLDEDYFKHLDGGNRKVSYPNQLEDT